MSLLTGMLPSDDLSRAVQAMKQGGRTYRMPSKPVPASGVNVAQAKAPLIAPARGIKAINRDKQATVKAFISANPNASRKATAAACGCSTWLVDVARAKMRHDGELRGRVTKQAALLALIRADASMNTAGYAKKLGCSISAVTMTMHHLYKLGQVRRVWRYEVIDA